MFKVPVENGSIFEIRGSGYRDGVSVDGWRQCNVNNIWPGCLNFLLFSHAWCIGWFNRAGAYGDRGYCSVSDALQRHKLVFLKTGEIDAGSPYEVTGVGA